MPGSDVEPGGATCGCNPWARWRSAIAERFPHRWRLVRLGLTGRLAQPCFRAFGDHAACPERASLRVMDHTEPPTARRLSARRERRSLTVAAALAALIAAPFIARQAKATFFTAPATAVDAA